MTHRDRKTLKSYFSDGMRPTAEHFADLVDSTLNMQDDGFSRSVANGVEFSLVGEQRRLMSFFSKGQAETPDWTVASDPGNANLTFTWVSEPLSPAPIGDAASKETEEHPDVLTLTKQGNVGVHMADPTYPLDVGGAIRAEGRIGTARLPARRPGFVPADGEWHPITEALDGCHAFEIVAGVGLAGAKKGRYALLHAVALNTFNPNGFFLNLFGTKTRIKQTQAWYLARGDRLKLRWEKVADQTRSPHQYRLMLKSLTSYGDMIDIQYSITQLWFDPTMAQCRA